MRRAYSKEDSRVGIFILFSFQHLSATVTASRTYFPPAKNSPVPFNEKEVHAHCYETVDHHSEPSGGATFRGDVT